ncbi:AAA family ATPase [candidate division KSB1 bacterium]|nr:AAA family ATPase [candidate division KSB1 bacterium]
MLTKLTIRNFKRFGSVEINLGNPVVFIGPNNSGKTSALQSLALWEVGLKKWNEKRGSKKNPEKWSGVTINRRDLASVPIPNVNLLWRNLHTREFQRIDKKPQTQNIRIDIIVEGITNNHSWKCGLEFDYANEESFYCRPCRILGDNSSKRIPVPDEAAEIHIAFLPPMSGLAANEVRIDQGAINVRVGEGRTAEVLRNLCYKIFEENKEQWEKLKSQILLLFGSELNDPEYIPERGEIEMKYLEKGVQLDISSTGRGLQQTLLLLAYMYANPGAVLLLDEPDAHLEILRQRQIYQILTDVAKQNNNQLIIASHSEVLLNEAADRDLVIAFVGNPHTLNDRGSQLLKSLKDIGFEQYYLAEQTGWALYLEGSTDLAILKAFADILSYEAAIQILQRPFVHYVGNQPSEVRKHFHGLREAVPHLKGIAIFDRLDTSLPSDLGAEGYTWRRREIENYFCIPEALEAYARYGAETVVAGPLFGEAEARERIQAMGEAIQETEAALATLGKGSPWDKDTKVSDDFLTPLFKNYFKKLNLPNIMEKKNFYELAYFVNAEKFDPEIKTMLDAIVNVAQSAKPLEDTSDQS